MKRVVLDASAVMTFFENRRGADKVEDLIQQAFAGKVQLLMSLINWGEVFYAVWRTQGQAVAEAKILFLGQIPLEVVAPDMALTKIAASFRAKHKLPYADAFAAALAVERKAEVLTSDTDFECMKGTVEFTLLK